MLPIKVVAVSRTTCRATSPILHNSFSSEQTHFAIASTNTNTSIPPNGFCFSTLVPAVNTVQITLIIIVTWPAEISHVNTDFLPLLYHNLTTIYTNKAKCLLLMQNLMGFPLQFTEMGYYNHN